MAQAFPLPSLSSIAILTDPKPVCCSPNTTNTDLLALGHKTWASSLTEPIKTILHGETWQTALIDDPLKSRIYGRVGRQTCEGLIRLHVPGRKKGALDSANNWHSKRDKPGHVHVQIHWERQAARYTHSHTH